MVIGRFDVFLIEPDQTLGSEIRKTRPGVVISPDEMNDNPNTVIIAPMTTKGKSYPCRLTCRFQGKSGKIVFDRVRAVDKSGLVRRIGPMDTEYQ
uniref:mRNA interferase MazF n=1 Tax=Candidatus Kentrum eta TaxID=2126337 RepID=A0A450VHR9_9GAMM|nr:MAG: mRNA interferase MazF [Candidatus Kentron sp. H]VFK00124.1 MAG: mRNA interferase MazF [Candidatus Kentron sp. H]VFK04290.1 MAG: mRNA interferase MazF [Candidatus Kentron sp. H]